MSKIGRPVGIVGIGSHVPDKIMTNSDWEKLVDTSDEWIVERTGIRERHVADEHTATSDLGTVAARKALADAGVDAEAVDLVIVATATPDMLFPSTACIIQNNIGAKNAAAFDLAAGCSGFVYAMTTGAQFIANRVYKTVLVIGAETLTKIMDWQDRNTCVLFGDGAAAVVLQEVSPGCGILGVHLGAEGAGGDVLKLPAGGSRLPTSLETVQKRQHYIYMEGNEVFKFAVKVMGEAAAKALEDAGTTPEDVDWLVPHQANIRIIQAAAKRLKMPMEKVIVNVERYGNTSAASIPLAIDEAYRTGRIKTGDTLALVGFGAGLTWAASVIKWCKGGKTIG